MYILCLTPLSFKQLGRNLWLGIRVRKIFLVHQIYNSEQMLTKPGKLRALLAGANFL
jgi:hypothetical protein